MTDLAGFGRRLRHARLAYALRRVEDVPPAALARLLGVESSTVTRWEKGERTPPSAEMQRIAGALGVSVGWLAYGEGEPPSADVSAAAAHAASNQAALDSLPTERTEPAEDYAERVSPRRKRGRSA